MSEIDANVETKTDENHRSDSNTIDPIEHETIPVEPITEKKPRNHHLKVENPKAHQVTFRVTKQDYDRIMQAVEAQKRKQRITNYNVGNLVIDMIAYMEVDFFASFKVK